MLLYALTLLSILLLPLHCYGALNPAEKKFAEFLENHKLANPGKPLSERTLEELRASTSSLLQYAGEHADIIGIDSHIPTRDGASIPIRIYNDHLENAPVLIFYPGCGFVFDLSEINQIICSRIALYSGIKVIMVQYRLAPENPVLTSIYDSYDAANYIATHPSIFNIDPSVIFLGGWCSGAHAATAVSSLARQNEQWNVFHQILLSGRYDLTESTHDFDTQELEDKTVSREFLRHITKEYYGISQKDCQSPLVSPYFETDFDGLPPTTILCGEYDALRNDSEAYFCKLKDNRVATTKIILKGQTHNTIMMRKVLSDGTDPAEVFARVIKSKKAQPSVTLFN